MRLVKRRHSFDRPRNIDARRQTSGTESCFFVVFLCLPIVLATEPADYVAICRPQVKPGSCPTLEQDNRNCERECSSDADCALELKCCSTGCGTACVDPTPPAQLFTQQPEPLFTESPVEALYRPPKVDPVVFKPEVNAEFGDQAILNCAVSGNPNPKITWRRGNILIDGTQERYRIRLDQSLQIVTLYKTDSGIYLCTADNGLGDPIANEIMLNVVGTTEASSSNESITGSTGTTVEFTGTTESTTEFTGSSESTTAFTGSTETDIFGSTTPMQTTEYSTETDLYATTPILELFTKTKTRMCKRRKIMTCKKTKWGCCWDKITPAEGPFDMGCPTPKTCKEAKYGCCEDGVSAALGPKGAGCPRSVCNETLFGCCWDNKTTAEGNDGEGCPPECLGSEFGCCDDNVTEAKGPGHKGCPEEIIETTTMEVEGTTEETATTESATDISTPETTEPSIDCNNTPYRCCPDGKKAAEGPGFQGCGLPCSESPHGCCSDGETPAHGPSGEGCCLTSTFGCCPDNLVPARGPNGHGCDCHLSPYGCCPDNKTSATGYDNEGCGCQYKEHGCCPDGVTEATGPKFEGCACQTFQFGCCPDGVTIAKGPHQQGCGCQYSEFGCCPDDRTPATGPNSQGCSCDSSKYGCCLDGRTEAKGEEFQGCEEIPPNKQVACGLPKENGQCNNYTVKWHYDMAYGGCSKFWYGGCGGNDNRFKTKGECEEICVEPQGTARCNLPKVPGPCQRYYPQWYYDTEIKQCAPFVYGGCLGNNNRFETREVCMALCQRDNRLAPVTHLNPPILVEESGGHPVVGEKLTLTCSVKTRNRVFFNWTIPRKTMEGVVTTKNFGFDSHTQQDLIIMNTTLKDNGMYVCKVWDMQNHSAEVKEIIKIFDVNENFLRISQPHGVNHIVAYAGQDFIQWIVDVEGHPQPIVAWLDNKMRSIPKGVGQKYEVDYDPKTHKARLRIKNIEIHDFGKYTVVASNNYRSKNCRLFLSVTERSIEASKTKFSRRKKLMIPNANSSDIGQYKCKVKLNKEYVYKKIFVPVKAPVPPQIHDTNMQSNTIEMNIPDNLTLICRVHGIPKPTIIWEKDSVPFNPPEGRIQILDDKEVIHFTRTDPEDQGTYKCTAKNKMGAASAYTSLKFKSKFGMKLSLDIFLKLYDQ